MYKNAQKYSYKQFVPLLENNSKVWKKVKEDQREILPTP